MRLIVLSLVPLILYWLLFPVYMSQTTIKKELKGKNIIVTGASQGIGKALVGEIAGLVEIDDKNEKDVNDDIKIHVIMVSRSITKLEAAKKEILSNFSDDKEDSTAKLLKYLQIDLLVADLSSKKACKNMIEKSFRLFGGEKLDVLILNHVMMPDVGFWLPTKNSASNGDGRYSITSNAIQNSLENMFYTNTFSYIWTATEAMPALMKSSGRLGIVSSLAGRVGSPMTSVYNSNKHALHGFFNTLRVEINESGKYGERNKETASITICTIGATDTEGSRRARPGAMRVQKLEDEGVYDSPLLVWDPPEYVAQSILKGLVKRKREIYHPHFQLKPVVLMYSFIPSVVDKLLAFVIMGK